MCRAKTKRNKRRDPDEPTPIERAVERATIGPAKIMRQELDRLRAQGASFDTAWARGPVLAAKGLNKDERIFWRDALIEQRAWWEACYGGASRSKGLFASSVEPGDRIPA